MFINKCEAVLRPFEVLLHFDQLFFSNLQSGDKLCTNQKLNYLLENVFFSKNDMIVTQIYLKNPGTKETKKK